MSARFKSYPSVRDIPISSRGTLLLVDDDFDEAIGKDSKKFSTNPEISDSEEENDSTSDPKEKDHALDMEDNRSTLVKKMFYKDKE